MLKIKNLLILRGFFLCKRIHALVIIALNYNWAYCFRGKQIEKIDYNSKDTNDTIEMTTYYKTYL